MAALPQDAARTGVFGTPAAAEPPYTATSLLMVGAYDEAAVMTDELLESLYGDDDARTTSNYARTLLIRALADAGRGQIASSAVIGRTALKAMPPVWSTRPRTTARRCPR